MREIKFRMWDAENEQMIDGDSLAFEEYAPISHLLSQEGIMQYTGLKDKNGKEIYEGDILYDAVKSIESYSEVKWELEMGRFEAWGRNLWVRSSRTEVIGNIWEHPHLLEGRDEA
ncbi:YopX family protein [Paenibacillus sp. UASWS1643]|uniref:YopX family protein n=1 Tax=Paenibacillus sp. UASWS1643 TaxID=2580422 RepID=UPI00123B8E38|nr:YopX family protein [Paenibacillus sp. UASWS1643]KAA8747128.1 hypothetical protein FE296_23360 [Paenibacillus sp. UASWS1643]